MVNGESPHWQFERPGCRVPWRKQPQHKAMHNHSTKQQPLFRDSRRESHGCNLSAVFQTYCPFWDLVIAWSDDWFVALPFGVLGSFVLLWVYCTEQHTKVEVSWEGHMDLTSRGVPSIGNPLWLGCGWTSSELTLGVSLVTYLIKNRSCG
jgi:hypothetical protein